MSALSEEFREKAKALIQASATLVEGMDQPTKNLVATVVGQVNGTMYLALADMLDYQAIAARLGPLLERSAQMVKQNDAIRRAAARAAASGDWNEFDRLAAGGEPKPAAGGAEPGGVA